MKKLIGILITGLFFSFNTYAQNYPRPDSLKRDSLKRHPIDTNELRRQENLNKNRETYQRMDSLQRDDRDPKLKPGTWRDTIPRQKN